MLAIIFANGNFCPDEDSIQVNDTDLVIAADGGSRHCQTLALVPDVLIGDLDSIDSQLVQRWEEQGVKVLRHPADKDQTDLELALFHAQSAGSEEALIYGAIGGRLDMTFGNLFLLAHPELEIPARLMCGEDETHLLRPGDTLALVGAPGEIVSLLPLTPGGARVTTQGLAYPLSGETLVYGSSRGISNRLNSDTAQVILDNGLLAVIHTKSK